MGDRLEDRASLKDLDGVRVVADRAELKNQIERQLQVAGIRVLGMGDFPTGDPHLRLTVTAASREAIDAAFVQLDFAQIVFLRRNPQATFNRAQTWKADGAVILGGGATFPDDIQREVARQVAQFIGDYRAVNSVGR